MFAKGESIPTYDLRTKGRTNKIKYLKKNNTTKKRRYRNVKYLLAKTKQVTHTCMHNIHIYLVSFKWSNSSKTCAHT